MSVSIASLSSFCSRSSRLFNQFPRSWPLHACSDVNSLLRANQIQVISEGGPLIKSLISCPTSAFHPLENLAIHPQLSPLHPSSIASSFLDLRGVYVHTHTYARFTKFLSDPIEHLYLNVLETNLKRSPTLTTDHNHLRIPQKYLHPLQ